LFSRHCARSDEAIQSQHRNLVIASEAKQSSPGIAAWIASSLRSSQ
jgi:hypothetical protein